MSAATREVIAAALAAAALVAAALAAAALAAAADRWLEFILGWAWWACGLWARPCAFMLSWACGLWARPCGLAGASLAHGTPTGLGCAPGLSELYRWDWVANAGLERWCC